MSKILVDTNLLLDDPKIIFKLKTEYDVIVISIIVLKELDKHKFNPDLSYSARAAINTIIEFKKLYPNNIEFVVNTNDLSNNDELIIQAAEQTGALLATKDISMTLIAESKGVDSKLYGNVANGIFNPYIYVQERDLAGRFSYLQRYSNFDYETALSTLTSDPLKVRNSWTFIFIMYNEVTTAIYANNPLIHALERIDNVPRYRQIDCDSFKLKAKDEYQICAFYALNNSNNVLITGKWGSGKSLISTAYAVANNARKTFISRPPVGIDKKYDIGFLPGGTFDKLNSWAMGFLSSLYYLYGNTKNQEKDNRAFDYVKSELFKKFFELIDINSLQGLSLLDDYLLLDEVQLCTIDLLSMALSRATKEAKIIMTGDLVQSYTIKPSNSGLLKLLRVLPHPSLAYVELKQSYRGDILELAEKLQDKTF